MREQLTAEAIALLGAALVIFWIVVVVVIRRHAQKRVWRTGTTRSTPGPRP